MDYKTTTGNNGNKNNDKKLPTGVDITSLDNKVSSQINNELQDISNKDANEIMAATWSISPQLAKEIGNINRLYSSSHGMFSSVPIICKGNDCAYTDVCIVSQAERIPGRRCPMEIAAIISRYEQWCMHFDIDISSGIIPSKDLVDATLIKDLVNIEVQQIRVENKIAISGDFMSRTLLEIDKKGNPYYGKDVSPETQLMFTLQQRKEKILNQLNSTRKDKAADKRKSSPSEEAIKLFQQIKNIQSENIQQHSISDIEFDEDGNIINNENIIEVGENTDGFNAEKDE